MSLNLVISEVIHRFPHIGFIVYFVNSEYIGNLPESILIIIALLGYLRNRFHSISLYTQLYTWFLYIPINLSMLRRKTSKHINIPDIP